METFNAGVITGVAITCWLSLLAIYAREYVKYPFDRASVVCHGGLTFIVGVLFFSLIFRA